MSDTQFRRPWWNRRDVLKGGAALAAGAWGLSPYWSQAAAVPTEFDGSKFKLAAPEPSIYAGRRGHVVDALLRLKNH
jgi:hypothetical protein